MPAQMLGSKGKEAFSCRKSWTTGRPAERKQGQLAEVGRGMRVEWVPASLDALTRHRGALGAFKPRSDISRGQSGSSAESWGETPEASPRARLAKAAIGKGSRWVRTQT